MQRRRGLVSQPIPSTTSHATAATATKRERSPSVSSDDSSYSNEVEPKDDKHQETHVSEEVGQSVNEKGEKSSSNEVSHSQSEDKNPDATKRKQKKGKRDMSDETRWQKMKVVGSEKEVMVDLSRVQKYVDYDSSTVQAFQSEVKSAKGNFRQQALADYSDL